MNTYPLVSVKDIVKIHYGKALKTKDRIESGSVPVFGANGQIGFHDVPLIDFPTLVIGRKGSAGEVTYTDCGGWVIDTAFYTEINKPDETDIRYLFYALKRANFENLTITTSIPGVNRDSLYSKKIPFPPLEEQKRIAAILDKADAIRRKRKEAIRLTEELLRSTFLDMFGDQHNYPMMSIAQLCKVKGGKRLPKGHQLVSYNTGYPYIRAGNLKKGTVIGELLYLTEETYQAIKRYTINADDVYITIVGAYIGDVGIIPSYLNGANLTENAAKLVIKQNKVTNYFLSHFLRSDLGQRQIKSKIKTTGQPKFALFRIEEIQVPIPPMELQIEFEKIVNGIQKQESLIEDHQINSENLFNSLLQKAFRGEL